MTLRLNKPLAVFDLETTGTDIVEDQIVEISVVKIQQDGKENVFTRRVKPTIPIPLESSMIHGIYPDDVVDAPTFKDLAPELFEFLKGCDFGGFNILRFDLPVLIEEFLRVDMDFNLKSTKVVDAQKIFHLMEKRTLSAAYKFYCGQELVNAHSAEADTLATVAVIKAQVEKYEGQQAVDNLGKQLGMIENNMASLAKFSGNKSVDLAGRFAYNQENIEVFNFGKYRGKSITAVLKEEPQYYDWIMKGKFPQDTKRKLTEIKLRDLNTS
ncbi:MAG: exonuclease domain-containing protein [Cyclobacteriaceae bacterium]